MKKFTTLTVLFTSALATVFMAIGLDQAAQKLDPVAQKSLTISTMETGEIAAVPCISCEAPDRTNTPDIVA